MAHPVNGIDHCFALVADLDLAAQRYAALGFTLSPRGLHSAAKGSGNHTIMFPKDYVELLGIVHPTELNAPRRQLLQTQGQGLHAIACRVDDAEQASRDLAALGLRTEGFGSFDRPVPLTDGTTGRAAFSIVSFAPDETPRSTVFMCQHKTPETVWLPDLLDHPNTACGLESVQAVSDHPETEAAAFARLWRHGAVQGAEGCFTVTTGPDSAAIKIMTQTAMAKYFPGMDLDRTPRQAFSAMTIRVERLQSVTDCLRAAGITPVATAKGLAVAPDHAAGVIVEFVPAKG